MCFSMYCVIFLFSCKTVLQFLCSINEAYLFFYSILWWNFKKKTERLINSPNSWILKRYHECLLSHLILVMKVRAEYQHVPNVNSIGTQDNSKSTADLSKSLESTRAHLQGQLRSKEAENNRLTVQIKVCQGHDLSVLAHAIMCNYLLFVLQLCTW